MVCVFSSNPLILYIGKLDTLQGIELYIGILILWSQSYVFHISYLRNKVDFTKVSNHIFLLYSHFLSHLTKHPLIITPIVGGVKCLKYFEWYSYVIMLQNINFEVAIIFLPALKKLKFFYTHFHFFQISDNKILSKVGIKGFVKLMFVVI